MGMESVLVQATPSQLQEFQENPRLVYQYVTGDPGEGAEFARMEAIARATFNRMGIPVHMRQAVESEFRTMAGMTMKPGPHPATPHLPELFIELRKFYLDAAEHGNGMIMKIL